MSDDIKGTVAQVKAWRAWKPDGSAFLDFERHKEGSDVTFLKINLCAVIDGRAYAVCRYDTCHGFLHVHRFWLPEKSQTKELEDPGKPAQSYRDWFRFAMEDLDANGQRYIELIARKVKK
jgi:hypothetical protein